MVPGSTLRYGSTFCIVTCSPRAVSNCPRLLAVRPLPSDETTPPLTKRCLVVVCECFRNVDLREDGAGLASGEGCCGAWACRPTETHPNIHSAPSSLTRPVARRAAA